MKKEGKGGINSRDSNSKGVVPRINRTWRGKIEPELWIISNGIVASLRRGDIMKSDFYFRKMERNRGGGFHFFFLIFIPARSDYISLFNRNEYYAVEG